MLPISAVAEQSVCVAEGLAHRWDMSEGAGVVLSNAANDDSAGALVGGTGWAFGPPLLHQGYALSFDGSDDRVVVQQATVMSNDSFSFSVWMQTDKQFDGGSIAAQWSTATRKPQGWSVHAYPDGSIAPSWYGDLGAVDQAIPTTILDGEWHYIAVVFLRDGVRASAALFVDGVFAGSTEQVLVGDAQVHAPLHIGASLVGSGFRGLLADLRIYSRALHPHDIAQLHHQCDAANTTAKIPVPVTHLPLASIALPSPAAAARSSDRPGGGRHGHRSDMALASAQFVLSQHSGAVLQQVNDPRLCALRRTLGQPYNADVLSLVVKRLSLELHTPERTIQKALRDPMQCTTFFPAETLAQRIPFPIDTKGIPVSSNRTWNRCIRTNYITLAMIRQNTDVVSRNARGTAARTKTCADYYFGENRWKHPDFPVLEYFTLQVSPSVQLALPAEYERVVVSNR